MPPDILRATYADLKTVKTRSTCQLILESLIEALTDVVTLWVLRYPEAKFGSLRMLAACA